MSPRVVLVGLGAVGAGYGSVLRQAGIDLEVLADPARIARYGSRPTVVNGQPVAFAMVTSAEAPADLVLVAVKRGALEEAIELLTPQVGPGTVILSLLNGIDSEEVLAAAFPQATVLLALSVGIDAVRDDREVHYSSLGRIVFGEPANPGPRADQVAAVAAIFDRAGVAYQVPSDMVRELWWKYLINVGVNQVSAIIGAPYRVFQVEGEARAVMIAAQREVIAVANALGIGLGEADLDRWLEVLAGLGPDNFTSMAQDALAGRPTEVDSFAGTMMALGERTGVPVPVNTVLFGLLKAREAVLARR
ncbi:2-dehydropantoate 2-reductase [Propionicimonas paludicola]|uniref:2-dehydropantoate 2-reductase n=1 Tax=Propionicimonas paludicola TaxID=185243 RepID=A0A2A9CTW4_9ACTN|nr:ketopantoate reductase family protein [Propionicimonas paludicola]PFG16989.1 2-dehydropantoate 2-reductase [Propionicimonas paludicola]